MKKKLNPSFRAETITFLVMKELIDHFITPVVLMRRWHHFY